MRYTVLDGWRGFFLIFMVLVHTNQTFHAVLGKLNHHYFGWVEDAQGFIFISGLVVGLVYGRKLDKISFDAMRDAMWKRCREIYKYHAGLILIFLLAALLIPVARDSYVLSFYAAAPVSFTVASLLLVAASQNMGILPMYIYFMMISPWVVLAINRGYLAPLIMISLGLWMFGQIGLGNAFGLAVDSQIASIGLNFKVGLFFNLLSWQTIFFIGLYSGYQLSRGRLDLEWMKQRQYEYAFYAAVIFIIALGFYDRLIFDFWISKTFSNEILSIHDRRNFTSLYFLAFLLDLYAITWLFVAGKGASLAGVRKLSRFMYWLFSRKFLVFLGQHSLQVFAFHMLLVYFVDIIFDNRIIPPVLANLYLAMCVLSLYIPAWLHAKLQARRKGAIAVDGNGTKAHFVVRDAIKPIGRQYPAQRVNPLSAADDIATKTSTLRTRSGTTLRTDHLPGAQHQVSDGRSTS